MKLRYINMYPHGLVLTDENELPTDRFHRETWSIDWYLMRRARKMRLETKDINSFYVLVCGDFEPREPSYFDKELRTDVPFDWQAYSDTTDRAEVQEMFCKAYEAGFERARDFKTVPLEALQGLINEFRAEDYRNRWTQKQKLFRGLGFRARLDCELDLHEFTLTLTVFTKDETLFQEVIYRDRTDPLFWYDNVKEFDVVDGHLLVVGRSYDPHGPLKNDTPLFRWKIPG